MVKGNLLFIGDHVAVRGDDGQVYCAVVHDFWMVPGGQKWVKLQWLLPKRAFALQIDGPPEQIDPSYFSPGTRLLNNVTVILTYTLAGVGPVHDRMEQIECIIDVFFSPQRMPRSIEGPTEVMEWNNPHHSHHTSSSNLISSRSSSVGSLMAHSDDGSRASTPLSFDRDTNRHFSDSEIEYRGARMRISQIAPLSFPQHIIKSASSSSTAMPTDQMRRVKPIGTIIEDVEIAHLLCSMN